MASPRPRPFRFTLQASHLGHPDELRPLARRAEDVGVATLTVADHMDDQLAPFAALMAAADATTTLRVGTMVLANDYRHPAVLAKEAATIDVLSGGRLELGLGAGWRCRAPTRSWCTSRGTRSPTTCPEPPRRGSARRSGGPERCGAPPQRMRP